jgi:putative FmdB family regulatory protein
MPLYEYYCPPCSIQFETLRPMSKMNEPATCPNGHQTSERVISMFTAFTKNEAGEPVPVMAGGGDACCDGDSCGCC